MQLKRAMLCCVQQTFDPDCLDLEAAIADSLPAFQN